MKNTFLFSAILLIGFVTPMFGQDYRGEWLPLFDKKDLTGQEKVLKRWEAAKPDDAELFVSYFNYYFIKSRTETLVLGKEQPKGQSLEMTKTDDPKVKAYLGTDVSYEKADVDAGLTYVDRGIAKYPDRLDMRFGKTFVLGEIGDFDRMTDEVIRIIERSEVNKNKWIGAFGKPKEDGQKAMLGGVQTYVAKLFDNLDDPTVQIRRIAEAVLKLYPDSVENLSNLAISYILKKNFDEALVPLLRAEKIAPKDPVILGNIANCYFNKHDKINAQKYYDLFRSNGDEQAKLDADAKLKEIKKW